MNNEFTICSENSLCNYYLFHGFTMISQSILRIYYESITNKQRKNYESTLGLANILSPTSSQIYYEFIYIANSSRIHLMFHEFIMNSLFISRISYEFTSCFANLLWINGLYRESNKNSQSVSRIYFVFTMKLLLFSRIYYKFTILIADLSRIHLLFREFTMNSLSISRIKYKSKFFLANSLWFCYWITDLLWIQYLFRWFTLD